MSGIIFLLPLVHDEKKPPPPPPPVNLPPLKVTRTVTVQMCCL